MQYREIISQYAEKGYARTMSTEEEQALSSRTWYLPHHPVFHPKKPGKLRVVFDAAAKFQGKSLNNSLLTGPDLLNSLPGVIIRFRTGRVAIVADIEAMFHQVKVNEVDADSLRFLWKDDIFFQRSTLHDADARPCLWCKGFSNLRQLCAPSNCVGQLSKI